MNNLYINYLQMGKLIELLNEYEMENDNYSGVISEGDIYYYSILYISKKFGFIKWLVENDKIDYEKIGRFKAERKNTQIISIANKSDFYLSLLMLLSISDTPIEDLVSYLI